MLKWVVHESETCSAEGHIFIVFPMDKATFWDLCTAVIDGLAFIGEHR